MHRSRVRSIEFDDRWMQMRARSRHARTRGHTVGRTHAYTRSVGHTHAHVRVLYHEIVPCVRCVTLTHTHARARPHSTVCDLSMRTRTYPPHIHIHMRVDRATFRGARPGFARRVSRRVRQCHARVRLVFDSIANARRRRGNYFFSFFFVFSVCID